MNIYEDLENLSWCIECSKLKRKSAEYCRCNTPRLAISLTLVKNEISSAREELKKELCSEKDGETGQPCSDSEDYMCRECKKINSVLGEKE